MLDAHARKAGCRRDFPETKLARHTFPAHESNLIVRHNVAMMPSGCLLQKRGRLTDLENPLGLARTQTNAHASLNCTCKTSTRNLARTKSAMN